MLKEAKQTNGLGDENHSLRLECMNCTQEDMGGETTTRECWPDDIVVNR